MLVNLDRMIQKDLVPARVSTPAIKQLHAKLQVTPLPTDWGSLKSRIGSALLPLATRNQVKGKERPNESLEICAVVGFEKVRKLLDKIVQRTGKYDLKVRTLSAPGAYAATVAAGAKMVNDHSKSNPDFTLSEWGTIFWAAPSTEVDRFQTYCTAAFPSEELATRLRDAFGLVQNRGVPIRDHLFLFRAKVPLKHLRKSVKLEFQFARPTTLDGWDNERFCQFLSTTVPIPGCGLTVDLENWSFAPGAAELVLTPLPLEHFECQYVGRIRALKGGSDADFLSLLLGPDDLAGMAARLDALATA